MMKSFADMTGGELVEAYNAMVAGTEHNTVIKFSDRKTGIRRCKNLQAALDAGKIKVKPKDKAEAKQVASASGFGTRKVSNRKKLFAKLKSVEGHQVPLPTLLIAVYGDADDKRRGPFSMVLVGVKRVIAAQDLPYEIRKEKDGKTTSYGLYKTD